MEKKSRSWKIRLLVWGSGLLLVQSAYLWISESPDLFYVGNVFAHLVGGLLLAAPLAVVGIRALKNPGGRNPTSQFFLFCALALFFLSIVPAMALVVLGNTRSTEGLLWAHIALATASAVLAVAGLVWGRTPLRGFALGSALAALAVLGFGTVMSRVAPDPWDTVSNPELPPLTMAGESMHGADGPFAPSAAETSTGGRIPSDFFMSSDSCGQEGCHADIHEQWSGSAHRFSSFNNQWYRKSIEYMQEVNGIQSTKWCAGCHDHAVLFNGMMDRPIAEILQTHEAQAGLGCNSCHAIVKVKDTMGNGGFYIEYPPLHDLAVSDNPVLKWLHDTAVHLDPGPHRRVFLKPFHQREQQAEFCSSCHKVHLDEPVNNYRWIRGFNEYDNWQASGVSGQGARSFYYPPSPKTCGDCHMPQVPSKDKGNRDGFIHDHAFPAANTAVPGSKLAGKQLEKTIDFLQANQVSVDIFAASPAPETHSHEEDRSAKQDDQQIASTFAVGEEAAMAVGRGGVKVATRTELWAPLDRGAQAVRPGSEIRLDVVVRTRGLGHFFPGGTVDAYDTWLELRATDSEDKIFYWSGIATEAGMGPVEESAHFYRALMVDANGNPINKRNAWAARAVVYVNLIPPGAAEVAHFRVKVPEDATGEIKFEARLNYRKFAWFNTQWAFGGRPADGEPLAPGEGVTRVTKHYDDREFVFGDPPEDVSSEIKGPVDVPIVVMDRELLRLPLVAEESETTRGIFVEERDAERWNDYGIGLLRQGDLVGAERAFAKVIEAKPSWAEGYANSARVYLQEGNLPKAVEMLERGLELEPDLAKLHFFLGVGLKERGEYDRALAHLEKAVRQYPRDRVVRNTIGRIRFLKRDYPQAIQELRQVLSIDPEDISAHYNLMLAYRGAGEVEKAKLHRQLYERFKADEDSQILTGEYRREHPHDNRERQPVHEHPSVPASMIEREALLRAERGEPNVVLPGQSTDFVSRFLETNRPKDLQSADASITGGSK